MIGGFVGSKNSLRRASSRRYANGCLVSSVSAIHGRSQQKILTRVSTLKYPVTGCPCSTKQWWLREMAATADQINRLLLTLTTIEEFGIVSALISCCNVIPINYLPERIDVAPAIVFILEVVRMLPDVKYE